MLREGKVGDFFRWNVKMVYCVRLLILEYWVQEPLLSRLQENTINKERVTAFFFELITLWP